MEDDIESDFDFTRQQRATSSSVFNSLHVTFDSLMNSRCSSLPEEWTKFISIMASARFLKQSLIEETKEELRQLRVRSKFITEWLSKGVQAVPPKLKAISDLNVILAHHPWKVSSSNYATLSELGWSSSESLHATLVLCFFHSLCSIVVAKDISLDSLVETSTLTKFKEVAFEVPQSSNVDTNDACSDDVSYRLRKCSDAAECSSASNKTLLQYFRRMRSKSVASMCLDSDPGGIGSDAESKVREFVAEASKFVTDNLETQYVDFKPRKSEKTNREIEKGRIGCMFGVSRYEGSDSSAPKVHQPYNSFEQFNWETDGYAVVSSLLHSAYSSNGAKSVASCFDEVIQSVPSLTLFSEDFRDHIWNYVHILFGIQFQDFEHENVNKVLKVDLKLFIKAAACYPDRVTETLINESLKCFSKHERFAINLLVCIARLHVSLLYSLKAFYDHQCNVNELED